MKYTKNFKEYVSEVLKTAEYKKDSETKCVVAIAPILPGCLTQGDNFEDARDNLIDAIKLWITVGLSEGEEIPSVNGLKLLTSIETSEQSFIQKSAAYA